MSGDYLYCSEPPPEVKENIHDLLIRTSSISIDSMSLEARPRAKITQIHAPPSAELAAGRQSEALDTTSFWFTTKFHSIDPFLGQSRVGFANHFPCLSGRDTHNVRGSLNKASLPQNLPSEARPR